MHDFFVGSTSEFLPGPIYDLNQIGQVVAGTYNDIHFIGCLLPEKSGIFKEFSVYP